MPRKYHKKSDYWEKRRNISNLTVPLNATNGNPTKPGIPDINFEANAGEPLTEAVAACGGVSSTNWRGYDVQSDAVEYLKYPNIRSAGLPFEARFGNTTAADAINLVMKAYGNVAIFRNAIETCVEFSCGRIMVKTPYQNIRDFVENWIKRAAINPFQQEFYREYYRSGNVFIYKFDGKISDSVFDVIKNKSGARSPKIPIRYILVNPSMVYVQNGVGYKNNFLKILSPYEIERLKVPKTEEDKQIFDSLPEMAKLMIKSGGIFTNIFIPMDENRLFFAFYKKQGYEPLAVPMGFPILNDIEWMLQLKKIDISLTRTIEQAILLITTGTDPDKGGINPNNITNLQKLFANSTIGRVLIADYTTKAEWKIPNISEILGPEKYTTVNQYIREGLQSILMGDDKFANAQMKARIFLERLREGQKSFLDNFLRPQIEEICYAMNFRDVPQLEYEKIDIQDQVMWNKLYLQMAQLGLISPKELFSVMDTGVLPDIDDNVANQKEYKAQRDDGLYLPLLGGAQPSQGRPEGTSGIPQSTKNISPIGTKASYKISAKQLIANYAAADKLKGEVAEKSKKIYKVKELSDEQLSVIESLAKYIILNEKPNKWFRSIEKYMGSPKIPTAEIMASVESLMDEHQVSEWEATILYKSVLSPEEFKEQATSAS